MALRWFFMLMAFGISIDIFMKIRRTCHPMVRVAGFTIIFWALHSFVFYGTLIAWLQFDLLDMDAVFINNWSSALRIHGAVVVLSLFSAIRSISAAIKKGTPNVK